MNILAARAKKVAKIAIPDTRGTISHQSEKSSFTAPTTTKIISKYNRLVVISITWLPCIQKPKEWSESALEKIKSEM